MNNYFIKVLKAYFILLVSKRISKCFSLEVQLMLLLNEKINFLRRIFYKRIYYKYHCEISNQSKIDKSVMFPHPIGIVIGSNAIIDKNCSIYQNVTLGSNFFQNNEMPHIKSNTIISAGAKVIGGVIIGENCIIGANAVVTKNIPPNSIVVGANIVHPRNKVDPNLAS